VNSFEFVKELSVSNQRKLAELGAKKTLAGGHTETKNGLEILLRMALANEISVAELAGSWIPTTEDWEIKIVLARQAGDEARHFQLIEKRLNEKGISMTNFSMPIRNALFEFLHDLRTPVERVSAGLFTLESIAYTVNENFQNYCEQVGDQETADIYRRFIQPDEKHHHELGRRLLEKYATTEEAQAQAAAAAAKTLDIAQTLRSAVSIKLGTSCLPGC